MMHDPIISIQRSVKKMAIFDGFEMVFPFEEYTEEAQALHWARLEIAKKTDKKPKIVFPKEVIGKWMQS